MNRHISMFCCLVFTASLLFNQGGTTTFAYSTKNIKTESINKNLQIEPFKKNTQYNYENYSLTKEITTKDGDSDLNICSLEIQLIITKGKNYEITNNSNIEVEIATNGYYDKNEYDLVEYDTEGTISTFLHKRTSSITLPAGHKIRVSVATGENITLFIPDTIKDMYKEVTTPALGSLNIPNGKNYEITNTSNMLVETLANGSYDSPTYDIIKYDKDGNIDYLKKDAYRWIDVEPGYKARISSQSDEGTILHMPYEFKNLWKEVSYPVFNSLTISKDKNYEFKNTSTKTIKTLNNSFKVNSLYDSVEYDNSNNIYRLNKDSGLAFELQPGYKSRISLAKGESLTLSIPYEFKDMYQEVVDPAFVSLNITKEKSYEFTNSSTKEIKLLSTAQYDANKYDIIKYNNKGTIDSLDKESYNSINLPSGFKMRISLSIGENITLYVPSEFKSMYKEVSTPVFKLLTINKGKNYEFFNSSNIKMELLTSALYVGNRYDIIKYFENGSVSWLEKNEWLWANLNPKNKMRLSVGTGDSVTIYIPYEFKDMYKEVKEPVFFEVDVKPGQAYEYTNNLKSSTQIISNAIENVTTFDSIIYNSNGQVIDSTTNDSSYIYLSSGEKVSLKLSKGSGLKFYLPYELIYGSKKEVEDVNNDGIVDISDLAKVALYYDQKSNIIGNEKYDINKDGFIDIYDIILVAKKFS